MEKFEDFDINDTLDYSQIFESIKRNKFLITIITASSLLLGVIYVSTRKPTWEGQFQIVIAQRNNSLKDSINIPGIGGLAQLAGGKSKLKTEVEILKSPSVLMPIFKEYKNQKIIDGDKKITDLTYSEWLKDYFSIKLIRGSEVLNISYFDTDKDLINDVLNKASNTYQIYSNKNRDREIELALDYLGKQVKIFQKRSLDSLKEVQEYALKHSLSMDRTQQTIANPFTNEQIGIPQSIQNDSERVLISKKINYFQKVLGEVNSFEKESPELLAFLKAFSTTSGDSKLGEIQKKIDAIDKNIFLLKIKYKSKDIKLIHLQKQLKELENAFTLDVIEFIKSNLLRNKTLLESITVPEDVLLKFKELVRKSKRDDLVLSSLDKEYQQTSLNKAKRVDPWQLITKPTLLDKAVAPRKFRILALSILFGIFSGISTAFYIYKNSKYVNSPNFINFTYGWKMLENLTTVESEEFRIYCEIISNSSLFSKDSSSVAFLKIGELDQDKYDIFINSITKTSEKIKFKFTSDIRTALKEDLIVIIGSLGKIPKDDLNKINNQANIIGKNINDFILI